MSKRFFIHTLGCKINQYESQSLRETWLASGAEEAADAARADMVCINSCAVTARAVRDLRQLAARVRRENPSATIVITGCGAHASVLSEDDLAEHGAAEPSMGPLTLTPPDRKRELLGWYDADRECGDRAESDFAVSDYPRARAILKVQDGCSHGCTYCIVPITRGRSVSRPPADIAAEVVRLARAGFGEVVVSGVNLRHYGRDLQETGDFWDMLAMVERELSSRLDEPPRLRLSSLDPGQLHAKALDTLAESRLVCPHLHVSLQSASPAVLRAMGRAHYGPDDVSSFVDSLAGVWPLFGLGADLLTGFPGETEEQFAETLDFCRSIPLTYAHVFPYSRRPGTRAADMPGQLRVKDKKCRAAALRGLAEEKKNAFLHRCAELDVVQVALESLDPAHGVTEHYASCTLRSTPLGGSVRNVVPARPVGVVDGELLAEPIE